MPAQKEQQKIGSFIALLRERKGLTQQAFAKLLGTSQSAVARMEKGQQNFSTEMLGKISAALGRSLVRLADDPSVTFKIQGGRKLSGEIKTLAAKNSAVALLCASLLNQRKTILQSVPKVEDVYSIIKVLQSLGAQVSWLNNSDVQIVPPHPVKFSAIDRIAAAKTRSSLLLIGALLKYGSKFKIPHSGGCKLGTRTVKPHLYALERLGVRITVTDDFYEVDARNKKPAEIVLYESGDTVTENAIMAASVIPGTTAIKYASANYMVQELCVFLTKLGLKIEGIGTTTLTVHGQNFSGKAIEYPLAEDPTESMLFLALAATTGSTLTILRCPIDFLELELLKLEKMGFRYQILKRYKAANNHTNLADIRTWPSKLVALEEKIYARPYPGLNIDNLPFFVPVATQAKGTTLIHDWVYENRAPYYLELNRLGVQLRLADPHRIYIEGPTPLQGAEIICPPALRPAAIILIAMLAAKGASILRNVYSINRGYEDLAQRLNKIGAKIEIVE